LEEERRKFNSLCIWNQEMIFWECGNEKKKKERKETHYL